MTDVSELEAAERVGPFTEVYVWGSITDELAREVIPALRAADLEGAAGVPLLVHVHSEGGFVSPGFAIYDAIRALRRPVHTVAWGTIASAALIPYLAGDVRIVHTHTRMMNHLSSVGADGGTGTMRTAASEVQWTDKRMDDLWQVTVGHPRATPVGAEVWYAGGRACIRAGLATVMARRRRRAAQRQRSILTSRRAGTVKRKDVQKAVRRRS